MRFFLWIFLLFSSPLFSTTVSSPVTVPARAFVVMEQSKGEVLEGKDVYQIRSVASISKILTAIIAIESDHLFDVVTVGDEIDTVVGSSLYLQKGTQITIMDLVYGLLLRSGNDAAMILAQYLGPGVENFVIKMNEKAKQLKMHHSTFHNPHGLDIDDEGNLSCAYDMALLMRYCLNNPLFRKICGTEKYRCPQIGTWHNKHRLSTQYEYFTGGKTGYTSKAKRTLITSAMKDEMELIVVTLDCGGDFATHRQLFEYYFKQYCFVKFLDRGKNIVENYVFFCKEPYGVLLKKEEAHHFIMLYMLDPNRYTLSFQIVFQDGATKDCGTITIENFTYLERSNA